MHSGRASRTRSSVMQSAACLVGKAELQGDESPRQSVKRKRSVKISLQAESDSDLAVDAEVQASGKTLPASCARAMKSPVVRSSADILGQIGPSPPPKVTTAHWEGTESSQLIVESGRKTRSGKGVVVKSQSGVQVVKETEVQFLNKSKANESQPQPNSQPQAKCSSRCQSSDTPGSTTNSRSANSAQPDDQACHESPRPGIEKNRIHSLAHATSACGSKKTANETITNTSKNIPVKKSITQSKTSVETYAASVLSSATARRSTSACATSTGLRQSHLKSDLTTADAKAASSHLSNMADSEHDNEQTLHKSQSATDSLRQLTETNPAQKRESTALADMDGATFAKAVDTPKAETLLQSTATTATSAKSKFSLRRKSAPVKPGTSSCANTALQSQTGIAESGTPKTSLGTLKSKEQPKGKPASATVAQPLAVSHSKDSLQGESGIAPTVKPVVVSGTMSPGKSARKPKEIVASSQSDSTLQGKSTAQPNATSQSKSKVQSDASLLGRSTPSSAPPAKIVAKSIAHCETVPQGKSATSASTKPVTTSQSKTVPQGKSASSASAKPVATSQSKTVPQAKSATSASAKPGATSQSTTTNQSKSTTTTSAKPVAKSASETTSHGSSATDASIKSDSTSQSKPTSQGRAATATSVKPVATSQSKTVPQGKSATSAPTNPVAASQSKTVPQAKSATSASAKPGATSQSTTTNQSKSTTTTSAKPVAKSASETTSHGNSATDASIKSDSTSQSKPTSQGRAATATSQSKTVPQDKSATSASTKPVATSQSKTVPQSKSATSAYTKPVATSQSKTLPPQSKTLPQSKSATLASTKSVATSESKTAHQGTKSTTSASTKPVATSQSETTNQSKSTAASTKPVATSQSKTTNQGKLVAATSTKPVASSQSKTTCQGKAVAAACTKPVFTSQSKTTSKGKSTTVLSGKLVVTSQSKTLPSDKYVPTTPAKPTTSTSAENTAATLSEISLRSESTTVTSSKPVSASESRMTSQGKSTSAAPSKPIASSQSKTAPHGKSAASKAVDTQQSHTTSAKSPAVVASEPFATSQSITIPQDKPATSTSSKPVAAQQSDTKSGKPARATTIFQSKTTPKDKPKSATLSEPVATSRSETTPQGKPVIASSEPTTTSVSKSTPQGRLKTATPSEPKAASKSVATPQDKPTIATPSETVATSKSKTPPQDKQTAATPSEPVTTSRSKSTPQKVPTATLSEPVTTSRSKTTLQYKATATQSEIVSTSKSKTASQDKPTTAIPSEPDTSRSKAKSQDKPAAVTLSEAIATSRSKPTTEDKPRTATSPETVITSKSKTTPQEKPSTTSAKLVSTSQCKSVPSDEAGKCLARKSSDKNQSSSVESLSNSKMSSKTNTVVSHKESVVKVECQAQTMGNHSNNDHRKLNSVDKRSAASTAQENTESRVHCTSVTAHDETLTRYPMKRVQKKAAEYDRPVKQPKMTHKQAMTSSVSEPPKKSENLIDEHEIKPTKTSDELASEPCKMAQELERGRSESVIHCEPVSCGNSNGPYVVASKNPAALKSSSSVRGLSCGSTSSSPELAAEKAENTQTQMAPAHTDSTKELSISVGSGKKSNPSSDTTRANSPKPVGVSEEASEHQLSSQIKEGPWQFSLKLSSVSLADLGNAEFQSLMSTAEDYTINMMCHKQLKRSSTQRGETCLYYDRLLPAKMAIQKLIQMQLSCKKLKIEVTYQPKCDDAISVTVVINKEVTGTLATDAANTGPMSKGSRENRNVYLSDIPECVSRDPLYVVFPSAYIIQEPREGATVLQFRNTVIAEDVMQCYAHVNINNNTLKLERNPAAEQKPNKADKDSEKGSESTRRETEDTEGLAQCAGKVTEIVRSSTEVVMKPQDVTEESTKMQECQTPDGESSGVITSASKESGEVVTPSAADVESVQPAIVEITDTIIPSLTDHTGALQVHTHAEGMGDDAGSKVDVNSYREQTMLKPCDEISTGTMPDEGSSVGINNARIGTEKKSKLVSESVSEDPGVTTPQQCPHSEKTSISMEERDSPEHVKGQNRPELGSQTKSKSRVLDRRICFWCAHKFSCMPNLWRHLGEGCHKKPRYGGKCDHCSVVYSNKKILWAHMRKPCEKLVRSYYEQEAKQKLESENCTQESLGTAAPQPPVGWEKTTVIGKEHKSEITSDRQRASCQLQSQTKVRPQVSDMTMCYFCAQKFGCSSDLWKHLWKGCPKKPRYGSTCEHCSVVFTSEQILLTHLKNPCPKLPGAYGEPQVSSSADAVQQKPPTEDKPVESTHAPEQSVSAGLQSSQSKQGPGLAMHVKDSSSVGSKDWNPEKGISSASKCTLKAFSHIDETVPFAWRKRDIQCEVTHSLHQEQNSGHQQETEKSVSAQSSEEDSTKEVSVLSIGEVDETAATGSPQESIISQWQTEASSCMPLSPKPLAENSGYSALSAHGATEDRASHSSEQVQCVSQKPQAKECDSPLSSKPASVSPSSVGSACRSKFPFQRIGGKQRRLGFSQSPHNVDKSASHVDVSVAAGKLPDEEKHVRPSQLAEESNGTVSSISCHPPEQQDAKRPRLEVSNQLSQRDNSSTSPHPIPGIGAVLSQAFQKNSHISHGSDAMPGCQPLSSDLGKPIQEHDCLNQQLYSADVCSRKDALVNLCRQGTEANPIVLNEHSNEGLQGTETDPIQLYDEDEPVTVNMEEGMVMKGSEPMTIQTDEDVCGAKTASLLLPGKADSSGLECVEIEGETKQSVQANLKSLVQAKGHHHLADDATVLPSLEEASHQNAASRRGAENSAAADTSEIIQVPEERNAEVQDHEENAGQSCKELNGEVQTFKKFPHGIVQVEKMDDRDLSQIVSEQLTRCRNIGPSQDSSQQMKEKSSEQVSQDTCQDVEDVNVGNIYEQLKEAGAGKIAQDSFQQLENKTGEKVQHVESITSGSNEGSLEQQTFLPVSSPTQQEIDLLAQDYETVSEHVADEIYRQNHDTTQPQTEEGTDAQGAKVICEEGVHGAVTYASYGGSSDGDGLEKKGSQRQGNSFRCSLSPVSDTSMRQPNPDPRPESPLSRASSMSPYRFPLEWQCSTDDQNYKRAGDFIRKDRYINRPFHKQPIESPWSVFPQSRRKDSISLYHLPSDSPFTADYDPHVSGGRRHSHSGSRGRSPGRKDIYRSRRRRLRSRSPRSVSSRSDRSLSPGIDIYHHSRSPLSHSSGRSLHSTSKRSDNRSYRRSRSISRSLSPRRSQSPRKRQRETSSEKKGFHRSSRSPRSRTPKRYRRSRSPESYQRSRSPENTRWSRSPKRNRRSRSQTSGSTQSYQSSRSPRSPKSYRRSKLPKSYQTPSGRACTSKRKSRKHRSRSPSKLPKSYQTPSGRACTSKRKSRKHRSRSPFYVSSCDSLRNSNYSDRGSKSRSQSPASNRSPSGHRRGHRHSQHSPSPRSVTRRNKKRTSGRKEASDGHRSWWPMSPKKVISSVRQAAKPSRQSQDSLLQVSKTDQKATMAVDCVSDRTEVFNSPSANSGDSQTQTTSPYKIIADSCKESMEPMERQETAKSVWPSSRRGADRQSQSPPSQKTQKTTVPEDCVSEGNSKKCDMPSAESSHSQTQTDSPLKATSDYCTESTKSTESQKTSRYVQLSTNQGDAITLTDVQSLPTPSPTSTAPLPSAMPNFTSALLSFPPSAEVPGLDLLLAVTAGLDTDCGSACGPGTAMNLHVNSANNTSTSQSTGSVREEHQGRELSMNGKQLGVRPQAHEQGGSGSWVQKESGVPSLLLGRPSCNTERQTTVGCGQEGANVAPNHSLINPRGEQSSHPMVPDSSVTDQRGDPSWQQDGGNRESAEIGMERQAEDASSRPSALAAAQLDSSSLLLARKIALELQALRDCL